MSYSLSTSYAGESLISGFNFISYDDPSGGFVSYQSQEDALSQGLYSIDPDTNVVRLGVDYTNNYELSEGRPSLRLESKEAYNHGLWIADFLHMPPSQCGVWPAFWAYGPDWPDDGELDIIEGANLVYTNAIAGHTADGCTLDTENDGLFTGTLVNVDCAVGSDNVGCGYTPPSNDTSSYGDSFNAVEGGVYAVEWDSDYLRVWHFPRGSIPSDIEVKKPDPSNWGLPEAVFGGSSCNVDSYFKNMSIVINIDFCGDYAGTTWDNYDTCTSLASTCDEYVANNAADFENVYWSVNYIDIYEAQDTPTVSPNSTTSVYTNTSTPLTTPASTPAAGLATTPVSTPYNGTSAALTTTPTTDPTTTTTMTTWSTVTVTEYDSSTDTAAASATASSSPDASNKAKIGDYSYLGCFRSSSKFRTFDLTLESGEMDIEKCIDACDGAVYIGVFEKKCYCATTVDADTRALSDSSDCDHVCPGDDEEFCGGLVQNHFNGTSRRWLLGRDAPNNYLLTVYADLADTSDPEVPPAMNGVDTTTTSPTATTASSTASVSPATSVLSSFEVLVELNTVTDFTNPLTTTITYTIPCSSNLASLMVTEYVATVEDCGCTEQPALPMETKVVECDGCGPNGESTITVTVPVTVTATFVVNPVAATTEATSEAAESVAAAGETAEAVQATAAAEGTAEVAEATSEATQSAAAAEDETAAVSAATALSTQVVSNWTQPSTTSPLAVADTPLAASGNGWRELKSSIILTIAVGMIFVVLL